LTKEYNYYITNLVGYLEGKMAENIKNIMFSGILFLFACCVSKLDRDILIENSSIQSQEQISGENILEAKELMNEFLQDGPNDREKYTGKKITITGEISNKATLKDNPLEKDFNYITFGNGDTDGICIMCYFNEYVYWTVEVGERITIEGNFRGIVLRGIEGSFWGIFSIGNVYKEIILGECKIIKEMN
jgi:hypothetical protein